MKLIPLALSALVALGAVHSWAQTSQLSTVAITTGVVTITERVGTPTNRPGTVGNNLAGLAYVAGNVPAAVDTSISFFTLTGSTLPPNPADAFTSYGTLISPTAVGSFSDVAAALTGSSYSGLAFAIDDLGLPIAGTFYTIHHRPTGDYFANIVPRTGGNSSSVDLKPMSWQGGVAGGPTDPGTTGYFGLAFVSGAVTGYSANSMFYLRTDGANTRFGEMIPALTAASTDKINLTTAVGVLASAATRPSLTRPPRSAAMLPTSFTTSVSIASPATPSSVASIPVSSPASAPFRTSRISAAFSKR
jgi:hypothetical protein